VLGRHLGFVKLTLKLLLYQVGVQALPCIDSEGRVDV
jgi:hypothetical protein